MILRRLSLVAVLAATALLPALARTGAAHEDDAIGIVIPLDCADFGTDGAAPDVGPAWCGELHVPENRDDPDGRELSIGFMVLEATGKNRQPDPLVYLSGGPGSSALASAETYAALFEPFRRQRDVILFDQRGTAFSSPLRCADWTIDQVFDLSLASLGDALAEPEGTPEPYRMPDEVDADTLLAEARAELGDSYARCAEQFAAQGVDLSRYNSIASADDAVQLVTSLGYDSYNLYGISYGARLALTIARDHPQSGLRSMVLDSVYPPQVNGFELYPAELPEVARQLFAHCAADPACSAAYPSLERRFAELLPRLDADPVPLPGGGEIDAGDLVDVVAGIGALVEIAPYVPRTVAELERGETATYQAIVSGAIIGAPPAAAPASDDPSSGAPESDAPDPAETEAFLAGLSELLPSLPDPAEDDLKGAAAFLTALKAEATAMPPADAADLLLRTLFLGKLEPTRQNLEEFLARSFSAEDRAGSRDALEAVVAGMDDAEIAALFVVLRESTDSIDPYAFSLNPYQFSSVECNEEIPFERLDRAVEIAREVPIPELAAPGLDISAAQFAVCEVWPSGVAPEIERLPVVSDVPALILAGAYDMETPVSWNRLAFVTLPNATYVQFPMAGHGVLQYSACAERIARAFVDDPLAAPDTACVAGLRPVFVGPDEPLPGQAPAPPPAEPAAEPETGDNPFLKEAATPAP